MKRSDVFIFVGLLLVLAAPQPSFAYEILEKKRTERLAVWSDFVAEAAQKTGLPAAWINAVILAESGGRTVLNGRPITSAKGAMGLMQLMPATYAQLRSELNLGADPYDPHDNILAGATYLRQMFDRYGYPGLFAAYISAEVYASGRKRWSSSTLARLPTMKSPAGSPERSTRNGSPIWTATCCVMRTS